MAFLVTSASSSLASGFPIEVLVTFLFALVHLPWWTMWFMKEVCQNASKWTIYNKKRQKKFWPHTPLSSVRSPTPFKNPGYATVVPLYSKWKVGASAFVCRVTLCTVYCWVHFVTIAKMNGNLFSGRPSKVLPWSWLKVLVLTKKCYLHHCNLGHKI